MKLNGYFKTGTTMNVTEVVDSKVVEAQTYKYVIQAIGKETTLNGTPYIMLNSLLSSSLSFEIKVLAMPTNVAISGYDVTWEGNQSSNGFSVNCGTMYKSSSPTFSLDKLSVGPYDLSVCSTGNGSNVLASNYSPIQKVVRLDAPTNIHIGTSNDEGKLMWDDVNFAQSYQVLFGTNEQPIDASTVDDINKYITTNAVSVNMNAVANYYNAGTYYITSQYSATKQFTKLNAISFSTPYIVNNKLVWNPSSNVNTSQFKPTYIVYDEENVAYNGQFNSCEMDVSTFVGGKSYTFIIKAVGDGTQFINSDLSESVSVYKLATPEVKRGQGCYTWEGVANAKQYVVYINGVNAATYQHDGVHEYQYDIDLSKFPNTNAEYKVEIIAIGDGGITTWDCDPAQILQKTMKLATPTIECGYSAESYEDNGEVVINVTKQTPFAKGYIYTVGGAESNPIEEIEYHYCTHSIGEFILTCRAQGGLFDDDGVLRLTSDAASKAITLFAAPANVVMNRDGVLSWSPMTGTNGYELTITYLDKTTTTVTTKNASYTLSNKDTVASVAVRAIGNGTTTITSAPSVWKRN